MGVGSVVPRSDTGYPAQHRYSVGDGRTATGCSNSVGI
jgi:hypothetical protein